MKQIKAALSQLKPLKNLFILLKQHWFIAFLISIVASLVAAIIIALVTNFFPFPANNNLQELEGTYLLTGSAAGIEHLINFPRPFACPPEVNIQTRNIESATRMEVTARFFKVEITGWSPGAELKWNATGVPVNGDCGDNEN